MAAYLIRRAARAVALIIAVSFVSFLLAHLAPGDFFVAARVDPQISPSMLIALRSKYGLDRSVVFQYARWLSSIARGEWGFSLAYQSSIGPLLWTRVVNTLLLTATANILAWIVAVPAGMWTAVTRSSWVRTLFQTWLSVALAVPEVVVVLLLLIASARSGLLPIGTMSSLVQTNGDGWTGFPNLLWHLAVPAGALIFAMIPPVAAHAYSAMAEALSSPYIQAARGRGIPRSRLLYRHAFPAASNALISLLGFSIGTLLSSSLLVEAVLGWPGIGRLLLEATLERDVYVVIDCIVLSSAFLIAGNFASDVLLHVSDPRIRRKAVTWAGVL